MRATKKAAREEIPGGLSVAIDENYIGAFMTRRVVRLCECFPVIGAVNQFA